MEDKMIYHGSQTIVEYPEVRKTKFCKDFSWGFYCTKSYKQASRWATRINQRGIINKYIYHKNLDLKILTFEKMTDEWLDFIAHCRAGQVHEYDIVEGPMADDTIWNFVNDYLAGEMSRKIFWDYAEFKHPTHQISFHTLRALDCLEFKGSNEVDENG